MTLPLRTAPGAITDVAGLKVGHFTDSRRPTGCTVLLCEQGAVCGVDVRGAAPGTRETDLLRPDNLVDRVHAVLLAGGSAFGLDAAGGVMRWLDEHGIGHEVGPAVQNGSPERAVQDGSPDRPIRVPIVPAAVLFDLWLGDPRIRPDADAGYAACTAARAQPPAQGCVGAGAGATVGKLWGIDRAMKGGIGSASLTVGGVTVGALVAVNAIGDVIDASAGPGRIVAGARTADGKRPHDSLAALLRGDLPSAMQAGAATTIGVVATDAALSKAQANKLATMAHDGLARTINPVHTMADGDTLFAVSTAASAAATASAAQMTLLGALAAEVTARAVLNAVRHAHALSGPGLPTLPAAGDLELA